MFTTSERTAVEPRLGLPAQAWHIPMAWYTSPDRLRAELEGVYARTWQMAGRSDHVAQPGQYLEYELGGRSILVVRGADGELRAFPNTCLHRGNRLRGGCGEAEELRCRYHRWAWDLNGSLLDIPDLDTVPAGTDGSDLDLPRLPVGEWGGLVFVHPGELAEPLDAFLAPVAERLAPYHFEQMTCTLDMTTVTSCNWKAVVDAFLEVYHVQGIHPQLLPMLDDRGTSYELLGPHSTMVVPFGVPSARAGAVSSRETLEALLRAALSINLGGEGQADPAAMAANLPLEEGQSVREFAKTFQRMLAVTKGLDFSGLTDDQMVDDWHFLVFPNLVFNTHAGGYLLFRIRPDAHDPATTWFDMMTFDAITDPAEAERRRADHVEHPELTASFGEVVDQDLVNLPGQQIGLASSAPGSVLHLSDQEVRIAHFHDQITQRLPTSAVAVGLPQETPR